MCIRDSIYTCRNAVFRIQSLQGSKFDQHETRNTVEVVAINRKHEKNCKLEAIEYQDWNTFWIQDIKIVKKYRKEDIIDRIENRRIILFNTENWQKAVVHFKYRIGHWRREDYYKQRDNQALTKQLLFKVDILITSKHYLAYCEWEALDTAKLLLKERKLKIL